MRINRDFLILFDSIDQFSQPIKVLKGPRQVGKTTLLESALKHELVPLDDLSLRHRAIENPSLFLDQLKGPVILDEATHAPELFPELKKRVDEQKRNSLRGLFPKTPIDIWITGSNQTLLEKNIQESLAGRASYFDLNTLSIHEIGYFHLEELMLKGGWPELYSSPHIRHVNYLNDLISTFIEKDIVSAAGIERKNSFSKTIGLLAARIGQLLNFSDIARNVGVETTTVQSWTGRLEQNGLVRLLQPYSSNLNQRLIKSPKIYFEDTGLATRFQSWSDFQPLYRSSQFGHLVENLALSEIVRFFQNTGQRPQLFFLRSKEKVEVDFLIQLHNDRWIACEVKTRPEDFSDQQLKLLQSTQLNVVEKWILTPAKHQMNFNNSKVIHFQDIFSHLKRCHV